MTTEQQPPMLEREFVATHVEVEGREILRGLNLQIDK